MLERKTRQILHMVFIKILLQQYKEQHLDFINKVLYMVVLMDYTQEVQLLVLLVVFKYLVELLVVLEVKMTQILHMVFIKSLELFKELKQVFINHKVLYKVIIMEYMLMVKFKVTI